MINIILIDQFNQMFDIKPFSRKADVFSTPDIAVYGIAYQTIKLKAQELSTHRMVNKTQLSFKELSNYMYF